MADDVLSVFQLKSNRAAYSFVRTLKHIHSELCLRSSISISVANDLGINQIPND
jgi:hypothetical protein